MRSFTIILSLLLIFSFTSITLADEPTTATLTTYYPAPYGSYDTLTTKNFTLEPRTDVILGSSCADEPLGSFALYNDGTDYNFLVCVSVMGNPTWTNMEYWSLNAMDGIISPVDTEWSVNIGSTEKWPSTYNEEVLLHVKDDDLDIQNSWAIFEVDKVKLYHTSPELQFASSMANDVYEIEAWSDSFKIKHYPNDDPDENASTILVSHRNSGTEIQGDDGNVGNGDVGTALTIRENFSRNLKE